MNQTEHNVGSLPATAAPAGIDLDMLEALLNAATRGDWFYQEDADAYTHIVRPQEWRGMIVLSAPQDSSGRARADARFVAAAKNAMPALLSLARRAAQQAPVAQAEDASLRADEATRLRRVVNLLSIQHQVPGNDASLRDCLFSALGLIAREIEAVQAQPAAAPAGLPLTLEEIAFVEVVRQRPGHKLNSGEERGSDGAPLWVRPQALGLIQAVGSYKWVVPGAQAQNPVADAVRAAAAQVRDAKDAAVTSALRAHGDLEAVGLLVSTRIIQIGNLMSNVIYELAQQVGKPLPRYECQQMDKLRKDWDAAMTTIAKLAQHPGGPQ